VQYVTPESLDALSDYAFFRDGILPRAGGLYDQPARAMEQMRIIEQEVREAEKDRCRMKK